MKRIFYLREGKEVECVPNIRIVQILMNGPTPAERNELGPVHDKKFIDRQIELMAKPQQFDPSVNKNIWITGVPKSVARRWFTALNKGGLTEDEALKLIAEKDCQGFPYELRE